MSQIKFRWVGLNKHFNEIQMQEGITTSDIREGNTLSFFAESNKGETGNCKFLSEDLFTGLKDKNGKEIYERDIFMNGESVRIIEFRGGNCHAITPERTESILLSFIVGSNPKNRVIGNIHEDPELLKS